MELAGYLPDPSKYILWMTRKEEDIPKIIKPKSPYKVSNPFTFHFEGERK